MPRLLCITLLALLVPALIVFAACGDDDDDGGGDRLSEEEYYAKMDEIDKDLDAQFDEVLSSEDATVGDLVDGFTAAIDTAQEQYGAVSPPEELEDEHDALTSSIDSYEEALTEAAADLDRDAEGSEFETIFADDALSQAEEDLKGAFCAIQDAADEAGVEADVGCEEDEESVDPSTLPAEEATEVLIEDFAFNPPHIQVSVGDTVTWTQGADDAPHTVTADDESFDSGTLSDEGESFEFTFEEAGEFSYSCEIHPEMLGLVTVVE